MKRYPSAIPTKILIYFLLALIASACSAAGETETPPAAVTPTPEPTPTPHPDPWSVTFETEDGVTLSGTLFGSGQTAVILAHQGTPGADQRSWFGFASVLAEHGYTALAFDFRGIGHSEGTPNRNKLDVDLIAAMQFLQAQGHHQIICIGASMGGTACMRVAIDHGGFDGLAALGSAMITDYGSGIKVNVTELAELTIPKLFIAAEEDNSLVVDHIRRMHQHSSEPKEILWLPGSSHGTDLFHTSAEETLTNALLDFIEGIVSDNSSE
jgi:pimeloyl-ACP methyl ester carboxylesterase